MISSEVSVAETVRWLDLDEDIVEGQVLLAEPKATVLWFRWGISHIKDIGSHCQSIGSHIWVCLSPSNLWEKGKHGVFRVVKQVALATFTPEKNYPLYRDRLEEFSKGSTLSNACRVLTAFTKDYLFYTFNHPPHLNLDNPHWTATFFRNKKGEFSQLGQMIKEFSQEEEKLLVKSVENTFLVALGGFSSRINSIACDSTSPNYDNNFLLNLIMQMLRSSIHHFTTLNDSTQRLGMDVESSVIFADFGKKLHRALSPDARFNEAEKRKYAIDHFFKEVAHDLLNVAFPQGSQGLEVPSYLRERLWDALNEVIVPNVICDMYEMVLHPSMLNNLMLTGIDIFNQAGDDRHVVIPNDKNQRELNQLCGKFISQLIQLSSPKTSKIMGYLPFIRDNLGFVMGNSIRRWLVESGEVDTIINRFVRDGLKLLHLGEWKVIDGKEVFVPLELVISPEGKNQTRPLDRFKFVMSSPARRRKEQEEWELQNEALEKKLVNMFDQTLNKQIKQVMPSLIQYKFEVLASLPDDWIKGYFGWRGLAVKHTIGKVCYCFLSVFGAILKTFTYPITRFGGILVDKYTKSQSIAIIKLFHQDILHNLVYELTDDMLTVLLMRANKSK